MKIRLPAGLFSLLLTAAVSVSYAESSNLTNELGDVMYVGDSITHGVNSASWRWAMHKIFTDNGISYTSVGYKTGNFSGGVGAAADYGGASFRNEHSSQASARAWELAGRKAGGRFDNTNLPNWLGQSSTKSGGGAYTGATFNPDAFYLLIGTNDLLSDGSFNSEKSSLTASDYAGKVTNLLGAADANGVRSGGDMKTILDSMYTSNPNAPVTILTIPCWTNHGNNNADEPHQLVQQYNEDLTKWVDNYNATNNKSVLLVDVNKGILDVSSSKPFYGCASMFNAPGSDGLHPSAQGDLIMAGNVAKAQGYAGRTAGQARLAAADFKLADGVSSGVLDLGDPSGHTMGGGDTFARSWGDTAPAGGFTLDFGVQFGNGATDGWDADSMLSVTLGNGSVSGTLNITEAYIKWGSTILYSDDMSANSEDIRVAYVTGNASEGVANGYYVWLGDMLIGEGLNAVKSTETNGVSFSLSGNAQATLTHVAMSGTGSYAPTSLGYSNEAGAFLMTELPLRVPTSQPQGDVATAEGTVKSITGTASGTEIIASKSYNTNTPAAGEEAIVVSMAGRAAGSTYIYGNYPLIYAGQQYGNLTQDVDVTLTSGKASAWYAANANGVLDASVTMRFTENVGAGSTAFGVFHNSSVGDGSVTGDVNLVFSAENAQFGSFTGTSATSVCAGYDASVGGTFHVQINSGNFTSAVMGGLYTGVNKSVGRSEVFINGGTVQGSVYGGGLAGSIGSPVSAAALSLNRAVEYASRVVLAADAGVAGSVFGGNRGSGASTYGNVLVDVKDGSVAGSVHGGNEAGTITGDAHVIIGGAAVVVGDVSGGGTGGSVNGDTIVTINGGSVLISGDIYGGGVTGGSSTVGGDVTINLLNIGISAYGEGFGGDGTADSSYAGTISGGRRSGTATLNLENVTADLSSARLAELSAVQVGEGTRTTLSSLGGASSLMLADGAGLTVLDARGLKTVMVGSGAELVMNFKELEGDILFYLEDADSYSITALDSPLREEDLRNVYFLSNGRLYTAGTVVYDAQAGTMNVIMDELIPEPSTAALSLLALAALAARRRRK